MNQTYDPILEITELRRVRTSLRSPEMGTALVLERATGNPVVVWPGERVPDARTGNYRRMFRVDTANRALSFTERVPSSHSAFPFSVTVGFACQVVGPVVIAWDRVRDMTAALRPSLTSIVRGVAARFDILDAASTEAMMTTQLMSAPPMDAVRLSGFAVSVDALNAAEIVTAQRELRVQEMRRNAMRPVAEGGRTEVFAQAMALNDGDPTSFLLGEQRAMLAALQVLKGSNELADFNAAQLTEHAMDAFFPGGAPNSKRDGLRDRIERKNRGAIEGGGPVIDEHPSSPPGDPTGPDRDLGDGRAEAKDRKSSRLRGTASRHHDEP
ncbi:MAG TPA: hypothetical protein VEO01_41630 [Pseudonocardiaceae bacterium]|nr:hypothetical protein [Pseudonocardiaceae bacterium]